LGLIEVKLRKLHPAQDEIVASSRRFNVLNCGRRFGKDVLGIDRIVDSALSQVGHCPTAWFSPTYKNLTEDWRIVSELLVPVISKKSEQEHRVDLINGGSIEMWSLDRPDSARGRAYRRIVINEAASVPILQDAWEQVIRPTLTDYRGDAWFLSTPRGYNFFKVLYDRGADDERPEWASWTYTTYANPHIPVDEIEAAKRELPEQVFAQEYLAQFISDQTAVFRGLASACVLEPQSAQLGHSYVIGCDWGKLNDFSVFSVIDIDTQEQVYLDRSNRLDYAVQVERLKYLCTQYPVQAIIAEANAMGVAIIEQVVRARLPVVAWTATMSSKQIMIESLALAIEQGKIKLLKHPIQLAELQAYEAKRTASGMMRYSAPEGAHDDTVMALGMAWLGARPQDKTVVRDFEWVA
jgi:hypothetical protein